MKNNQIKAAVLALCGALALCGCSQKSSSESSTGTSSIISSVDSSTEKSYSSSVTSSAVSAVPSVSSTSSAASASSSESSLNISSSTTETSSGSSTTTNEPVRSTSSSVEQTVVSEPEWTESSYSAVMYVNTDCYSRVKPILGFTKAGLYHINDKVNVVAKTNTDYYKLDNGEFINVDYLSANKIAVPSSSSSASSSKSSSSSSSSSRYSDIVYIEIGSSIGRPFGDFFN